ncbi:MAG: hypothetical protein OYH76_10595 [Defluviicoccus sp.]|nr:hypothetical protein [Defluviicoccus sp.]MDE0276335.1 hypothetical protein [Defluviicoccus sp.]
MTVLKHTKGMRGGATSSYWTESFEVELLPIGTVLEARMSGPNYGTTVVRITIGPQDYRTILRAMIKTDRKTALRAMAGVLARSVG